MYKGKRGLQEVALKTVNSHLISAEVSPEDALADLRQVSMHTQPPLVILFLMAHLVVYDLGRPEVCAVAALSCQVVSDLSRHQGQQAGARQSSIPSLSADCTEMVSPSSDVKLIACLQFRD